MLLLLCAPLAAAVLVVALTMIAINVGGWGRWAQAVPFAVQPATNGVRRVPAPAARYVSWEAAKDTSRDDVLVLDCTHATAKTLTHHKGHNNPPGIAGSDCSTGLVLNALSAAAVKDGAATLATWLTKPLCSANHFDADAVLSMWCYIHGADALQHDAVLRHAARIGDMREAGLGSSPQAAEARRWDGIETEDQVLHALKLCCWINTIERTRFSPPYMDKDSDEKHAFFLERLAAALTPEGIEQLRPDWDEEYQQVLADWQQLEGGRPASVRRHEDIGLAVLRPAAPLHYYAAFSFAIGCDTVLTMLPANCFEVESRYTQFVCVHSRPVHARLDMGPLAKALNRVDINREEGTDWACNSFVDTGPILRLDRGGAKLSKAERYGQPTERPHYKSGLAPDAFEAVVASYLRHGLQGTQAKVGGWAWDDLHELNASIDWTAWEREVLPAVLAA